MACGYYHCKSQSHVICCCTQVYFAGSDPLSAVPVRISTTPSGSVEIHQPPLVLWSDNAHKAFGKAFKDAVKAFLLCHYFLSSSAPG